MGPLSTNIRMWGAKKFAELRGVVKENAGKYCVNPLKAELNPICHLLALLGAHHVLHVSRVGVKLCYNKKGNVGTYNVTLRRDRATIVVVEKK